MSRRYERLASAMVGTPVQAVAEKARGLKNARTIRQEPGMADVLAETRRTYELMAEVIRPETTCVDVGAHLGVMLHRMVKLAPQGRHHAFEPVPYKAAWLRRKFPSVTVHEMALADHDATETFHLNTGSSALSALRRPSEDEIRTWLKGNICRCTGYHNIVKAVQIAANTMSGKVAAE